MSSSQHSLLTHDTTDSETCSPCFRGSLKRPACDQWQAWARRHERKQRRRSFFGIKKKSDNNNLLDDDVDQEVEQFMKFDARAEPMGVKMVSF